MSIVKLNLHDILTRQDGFEASVLHEHDQMKVRRIELAEGAQIPPCQMQEDVVFVVLSGRVTFHSGGEHTVVVHPGAVFIPGGATTRSMEAHAPSLILAVLCRSSATPDGSEGTSRP